MARQTEAEKAACERIMAEFKFKARPVDADSDLALAAERKEAIARYKRSRRTDDFPGLRCAFGRACKPLPPSTP